jgi:hypothetical protein
MKVSRKPEPWLKVNSIERFQLMFRMWGANSSPDCLLRSSKDLQSPCSPPSKLKGLLDVRRSRIEENFAAKHAVFRTSLHIRRLIVHFGQARALRLQTREVPE